MLQAEKSLQRKYGLGLRGGMFWTIDEEGEAGIRMAPALAEVFSQTGKEHHKRDL